MLAKFVTRIPWLNPRNPIVGRELRRVDRVLPKLIRKLADPWTLLGYAALVHGILFIISMFGYNRSLFGLQPLFIPFLTPFGTPIAAAILHSILYWCLLIGISKYTVQLVGRDVETGTWSVLNATPIPSNAILSAKMGIVLYVWGRVLRSLLIIRAIVLLMIPVAIFLQQQTDETRTFVSFDAINGGVFLLQPFVDAFLIASLSAVAALYIPSAAWARIGAYGLSALVYGAINAIGAIWLVYNSSIGALAGLFVPLGHWAPLVTGILRPQSPGEFTQRILAVTIVYLVLPVLVGGFTLLIARRRAQQFVV